jgi:hypothetical protein
MACKSSREAHGKIGARASPFKARTAAIRSPAKTLAASEENESTTTAESARGKQRGKASEALP